MTQVSIYYNILDDLSHIEGRFSEACNNYYCSLLPFYDSQQLPLSTDAERDDNI